MSVQSCSRCNLQAEGTMIKCTACDLKFHPKCAKVNESVAEELCQENGLQFYCEAHRFISVAELLKKISKLQSFHVELKLLMDRYKEVLEMTSVSELRKLDVLKEKTTQSPSSNVSREVRASTKRQTELVPEVKKKPKKSNQTVATNIVAVPQKSNVDSHEIQTFATVTKMDSGLNNDLTTEPIEIVPDFSFTAIPPVQKVFVSRLPTELTTDIIKNHVISRLKNPNLFLNVTKLPLRNGAQYSSMVLNFGHNEDVIGPVMSEDFWPRNTLVRLDIPRELRFNRTLHANPKN